MEIDAGEPMQIMGVIIQGMGLKAGNASQNPYVKLCQVEYRLGDISGSNFAIAGVFSTTDGSKKQHTFSQPVYARYIRFVVLEWNDWISMRAGLIVETCSACPQNANSPPGSPESMASIACECSAGSYQSFGPFRNSATALVSGRAQLSTMSNRNLLSSVSTAVFDTTAGPPGSKGALTFN